MVASPARIASASTAFYNVLIAGIPWEMIPKGFPSYKTCLNRFKEWLGLGVFQEAWRILAERCGCGLGRYL